MHFFGSLPCHPSHSAYANVDINYYANVTLNHYANVTAPTCQTGERLHTSTCPFLLFFWPLIILNLSPSLYGFSCSLSRFLLLFQLLNRNNIVDAIHKAL